MTKIDPIREFRALFGKRIVIHSGKEIEKDMTAWISTKLREARDDGREEGQMYGRREALDLIADKEGWEESYDKYANKLGLPTKYTDIKTE